MNRLHDMSPARPQIKRKALGTDILVRADGVELTPKLLKAIGAKIGRVRQYAPDAIRVRVQLCKVKASQYRVHVLYEVKGNDVSAEHTAQEPLAALDLVAGKIERRLRRRKTARLARRVRAKGPGVSRHQSPALL